MRIQIVRQRDDGVVKELGPISKEFAESIEHGANIVLNHEDYYTRIVEDTWKVKADK